MNTQTFSFSTASVKYYFNAGFDHLQKLVSIEQTVLLTDENIFSKHKKRFKGWKTIVIKAGEAHKNQSTVDNIIRQLIETGADRKTTLVGIGGGVITDITGYVAGIFLRGISFGFVPTSILAMVDASVGGKNGVDVGLYKNMVGLIRQPSFILFDYSVLKTLPKEEWINGFAEIIKHATIKDAPMFKILEEARLTTFQKDSNALAKLIQRNVLIKTKVVLNDEFESGERKQLNFGHTLGHAIENLYQIPHGHAISIGMGLAGTLSEKLNGFKEKERLTNLLKLYGLPPQFEFDKERAFDILLKDKKKAGRQISFVLLKKIGKADVQLLSLEDLHTLIQQL
ncbi:MAG: 3-dehydroquinate synthase [Chitinophagaceae bacterium]|nr:3-dehydroquinate synthase [Chitinophagaceae bacterium]